MNAPEPGGEGADIVHNALHCDKRRAALRAVTGGQLLSGKQTQRRPVGCRRVFFHRVEQDAQGPGMLAQLRQEPAPLLGLSGRAELIQQLLRAAQLLLHHFKENLLPCHSRRPLPSFPAGRACRYSTDMRAGGLYARETGRFRLGAWLIAKKSPGSIGFQGTSPCVVLFLQGNDGNRAAVPGLLRRILERVGHRGIGLGNGVVVEAEHVGTDADAQSAADAAGTVNRCSHKNAPFSPGGRQWRRTGHL
ncbi:hypothetical protein SDC9_135604 [bioreactor metagenome]|uniref:Uncharacterized protein n=1 Tax=bioreactor metagenome TaxID=1076179 RepID=A0A645DG95_9ZZZZ